MLLNVLCIAGALLTIYALIALVMMRRVEDDAPSLPAPATDATAQGANGEGPDRPFDQAA